MEGLLVTSKLVYNAYGSPPIGLYRLKNYMESAGHKCEVFDTAIDNEEEFINKARDGKYDFVGFSVTHKQMEDDMDLISAFRFAADESPKDTTFIAGGQEATYNYQDWLKVGIDYIFLGFAQDSFMKFVNDYTPNEKEMKKRMESVPGVAYVDENGENRFNDSSNLTLDEFVDLCYGNFKTWDIPYQKYWDYTRERMDGMERFNKKFYAETVRLFTTNQCPSACGFCSSHLFLKVSQGEKSPQIALNAEQIYDMVKWHSQELGARCYVFSDDEFVLNLKRTKEFSERVIEGKKNGEIPEEVMFSCQARIIDFLRRKDGKRGPAMDLLDKMAGAGFYTIGLGIETFSSRLLKLPSMNKFGYNKNEVMDVVNAMMDRGMAPNVFTILFIPETNVDEVEETINTSIDIASRGAELVCNPIMVTLPGAPIYYSKDYPRRIIEYESKYTGNKVEINKELIPWDKKIADAAEKILDLTNEKNREVEKQLGEGQIVHKSVVAINTFQAAAELLGLKKTEERCKEEIDKLLYSPTTSRKAHPWT